MKARPWMTTTEAARVLGIHRTTVVAWAHGGTIPAGCYRLSGHRRPRVRVLRAWATGKLVAP